jgi:hypothetical protein
MRSSRTIGRFSIVLMAGWALIGVAHGQVLAPAGSNANGPHALPTIPAEGPDIRKQFESDPTELKALQDQARLQDKMRQTELVKASDLLLKLTQDLRAEMTANPSETTTAAETELLKQIQKLARLIQDREMAQDEVTSDLAKAGMWP